MPICKESNCKSEATYGFKFAQPEYCREHGLLYKAKTQYQICKCGASPPRFKLPTDERVSCCGKCKTDDMINVVDRKCKCEKHCPSYGKLTDKRPDYCVECKTDDMINLKMKSKLCKCGKASSSFGFPTDKKATCCVSCKEEGMKNIVSILCPCGKTAVFGFKTDKAPTSCKTCAKEGMENIITKKCTCGNAVPVFGLPSDTIPRYCMMCKQEGMVNISAKKCTCGKAQPIFGLPNDKSATCCVSCKTAEMIDIRSVKCKCGKSQPVYGLSTDKKASCCVECKTVEMVNIKAKRCVCGKAQPFFGMKGDTKAFHCGSCKKDGMIDILSIRAPTRTCKGTFELQEQGLKCPFEARGKKKYDYYCTKCFEQNFPQDIRSNAIRSKTPEYKVRDFLAQHYTSPSFIHNKALYTGQLDCSCRRRIDFRALYGNTLLCIEVDEEQHKYRNKEDETLRYDDLMMLHGGKFMFIRLNPDSYIDIHGKKKNPFLDTRLDALKEEINYQIYRISQEQNKEFLEVKYLYFDEIKQN